MLSCCQWGFKAKEDGQECINATKDAFVNVKKGDQIVLILQVLLIAQWLSLLFVTSLSFHFVKIFTQAYLKLLSQYPAGSAVPAKERLDRGQVAALKYAGQTVDPGMHILVLVSG